MKEKLTKATQRRGIKTEKLNLEEGKPEEKVEKAEKKTSARTTAKKTLKAEMTVQFAGKSYSQEELIKITKDVWRFDLKRKVGELQSIQLYIKPEEETCYYVINGEIEGSFKL